MPEQFLHRRTIFGWLSILAALTSVDEDQIDLTKLVDIVSFAVALIDIEDRCVLAMSPRMRFLVDGERDDHLGLRTIVQNQASQTALLALLKDGSIDGYEALRTLRGRGQPFEAWSWVSICEPDTRRQALWVIAPVGDEPWKYLPEPSPSAWPARVGGVVVGKLDVEWHIEEASVDVIPVLGYRPDEVAGRSLVGLVHPDDVATLVSGAAHSVLDRAAVGVQLRVQHASGEWMQAHVVLTLLTDTVLRFGFVLAVPVQTDPSDPARATDLERRLWRIAREVEEAGVIAGFEAVPDERALPALGDLAPRQWEVLSRLLRGERVPTIAERMYVSHSTVRNHLNAIFRKLGVHSQHELLELVRSSTRSVVRKRTDAAGESDDDVPAGADDKPH